MLGRFDGRPAARPARRCRVGIDVTGPAGGVEAGSVGGRRRAHATGTGQGRGATGQRAGDAVGAGAVLPADCGVHGDQGTDLGFGGDDPQQRAGPGIADPGRQAASGHLDQAARRGVGQHVLGQQRHVVPGGDHLAQQRQPEHLRGDHRDDLRRPGEQHPGRRDGRSGANPHLAAVAYAEVAQHQVVGVQQGAARGRLGRGDDPGGHPPAGQPDRIARPQAQRGEHLGVQPDDAAPGVQCGRPQARGQGQLGFAHRPTLNGPIILCAVSPADPRW